MSGTSIGTSGATFPDGSVQATAAVGFGFKNRLINGDMRIDQRYAGAAWGTSISGYTIDRWQCLQSTTGKLNGGQNWNAVTPPPGFTKYIGAATSSAYSVAAGDYYSITQQIEGFNISDFAWGTASASPVTLSFRVYSSSTGTFGGSLKNGAGNRSYPFTYSVPTANTWTTVSVTVPGDTAGTWTADNTTGMLVNFGLGVGSTYSGTAGAWAAANYVSATGAVSIVGTLGAIFYITGVQLEKGSTATSFDYRPYGAELALCQRYYEIFDSAGVIQTGFSYAGGTFSFTYQYMVQKRAIPTVGISGGTWTCYVNNGGHAMTSVAAINIGTQTANIQGNTSGISGGMAGTASASAIPYLTAAAEL